MRQACNCGADVNPYTGGPQIGLVCLHYELSLAVLEFEIAMTKKITEIGVATTFGVK